MYNGSPYNDIYSQQSVNNRQSLEQQRNITPSLIEQMHPHSIDITVATNPVTAVTTTARGDPPSYEEAVVVEPNSSLPPPSYDSLYGRVREAQKQSKGIIDFIKNVFVLLLGTIGCTVILGITIVIPACMIAFGSIYLNQCPQGEFIPVYLLVGGIMGVIKPLLSLSTHVRRNPEEQAIEQMRQSGTQTLINWFMLGWFMIGSYWVYRIYEPNYDESKGKYCNQTLYMFSFWLISSIYISVGLVTICLLLISILSIVLHRQTLNFNV